MAAAFFVTVADEPGRALHACLFEAKITDLVNDGELWLSEHFHGVGQPILSEGSTETACHFHGG